MLTGPDRSSKPILIFDAVASEAMTIDLLCRSMGVETLCALNAADAAAALARIRPAGIITDLGPGGDGPDCLRLLAEHAPTVPIMVVTAGEQLKLGTKLGDSYGLSDLVCVSKPMELAMLRAFLARAGRALKPSQWDLH